MAARRCPYCRAFSNFTLGSSIEGGHEPGKHRVTSLDICQNCNGVVYVVTTGPGREGVLDMYPKIEDEVDDELPDEVKKPFDEALRSLNERIWNGCVTMCRRALAEALAERGALGNNLFEQIKDAVGRNMLTPSLGEWADESRLSGNLGAHGTAEKKWADETDAAETVEFCRWVFRYIYVLPTQLIERRKRLRDQAKDSPSSA